ncbi:molybdopterin molybdotransferase MoeA [Brachyspira pilosicoli]|uniref:molybdopterin molybdotransferase MoeA n=1 Tax=Brachyspira pilosicoli TaxID=52584 RepID=UPI003005BAC7
MHKLLVNEVYNIIFNNSISLQSEVINIKDAYKRVLKKELYYKIDDPPFNKSAMDGYGYFNNGNKKFLLLKESIIAGNSSKNINIPENCCIKIMTGAVVPNNINKISKFEAAEIIDENEKKYVYIKEDEKSDNIIYKGSGYKKGDLLLNVKILEAEDISKLASNGYSEIEVVKNPKIAFISTGNELTDITKELEEGKIYDSNSFLIKNKLKAMNIECQFYGIVKDDYDSLYNVVYKALDENDIIIVSGGISFGDMDFTKEVFNALNIKELCHGVKIKPGKPFYFGKKDNKAIFGLPGNPFAVLVAFENFVKPYIYNSMGCKYNNQFFKLPLLEEYKRKKSDTEEYLPAEFVFNEDATLVKLIDYKGSFYLPSNIKALVKIDVGVNEIKALEKVNIKFI